ncbi:exopolyphosphatase/guanosine-5'-triphosphate,3'-diphosphate pyrophosphatase [Catenuloplanes nepalensis]|uniref:Exopolyphosphatase/guanosine-5'-triphosphate, 3'-diphosphate pyrophosphatase n=1 Tax=Catenuloplanes nepalensis TaxID=587533 RepID=A0ABT9MLF9_9ACTN|nr:Ppx/GppA family phosphatase [Catenuloplanes nepalensis]MDP9792262.1 exopolyphosphatase/guanosine-5'-triphosphate,3'-diphosphate pyrophosphatase [Catenuloplanes nepalensis]
MRIGVLDVGSNTAQLVVTDVGDGVPLPVHAVKEPVRLAEVVGRDGELGSEAIDRLATAVGAAAGRARRWEVRELFAYATAVVRDAPNRDAALGEIEARTGVRLGTLSGTEEAELTFLAVRRWMGWRAGPLLLLDIGGGSAEIAYGHDLTPSFAVSLPIGAARITRERLRDDPPEGKKIDKVRCYLRRELGEVASRMQWDAPRTAVATSRTFQQLAQLCGAPSLRQGPFVPRVLRRDELARQIGRLGALTADKRARLPGISAPRARQSLAGALVAHTMLDMFGLDEVTICPWALREGILLRRVESADSWADRALTLTANRRLKSA